MPRAKTIRLLGMKLLRQGKDFEPSIRERCDVRHGSLCSQESLSSVGIWNNRDSASKSCDVECFGRSHQCDRGLIIRGH